jgi:hypothetical protein
MKFGGFHGDGGLYFAKLGPEGSSTSENKVLFSAAGSTDPVLYGGERASAMYRGYLVVILTVCVGVPKQEFSSFHRFSY